MKGRTLFLAVISLAALAIPTPAFAQEGQPGGWGEVIDANGTILYDSLTDLGEIQVQADWMPEVPFIEGQATYHQYLTPGGSLVVMPSASTLFFMALNPEASRLDQADGMLGNGIGVLETMLAGYITPQELASSGFTNSDRFFEDLINGRTNIWTFGGQGVMNFMLDLMSNSLVDENLYTMLLLYSQGNCAAAPGGCPAGLVNRQPTPLPPGEISCPAAFITTTPIVITGGSASGQGVKIAPLMPVVVGQDPQKRGVDLQVNASIPPVIYHTYEKVRHEELGCIPVARGGSGCPGHPASRYYNTSVKVRVECVEHTRIYPDALAGAQVFVSLTQASRQWILTDLARAYPGAHLINPDFTFKYGSAGSSWSMLIPRIQAADPGEYAVTVSVQTTGTPVSAPRSASMQVGRFSVEMLRVTLIEAP